MALLDNGMDWDCALHRKLSNASYLFQPDTSTSRFDAAINGAGGVSSGNRVLESDLTHLLTHKALIDHISSGEERWSDAKLQVFDVRRYWTKKRAGMLHAGFPVQE